MTWANNEWRGAAPLPAPLANAAVTAAGGRLFVAGGSSQDSAGGQPVLSAALFAYDPQNDRWSEAAALPYPVAGAALASDETSLYLIGGWDGRAMHDEIWRFPLSPSIPVQPKGGEETPSQWQLLGNLSSPRAFLGAAMVGGEIYIAGGYDGQRELDLAEVFTPATGERRQLPSLGSPRGGLALVYDGLGIYALGEAGRVRSPPTNAMTPPPMRGATSPRRARRMAQPGRGCRRGTPVPGGRLERFPARHPFGISSSFRALLPVISNP